MRPTPIVALFVTIALALGACAGGIGAKPPKVYVAGIEPVGGSGFDQTFNIALRIQNPNDHDLDVRGLSFDLYLNGREFASGVSDRQLVIPRLNSGLVNVQATTSVFHMIEQAVRMSQVHSVSYEIDGELHTGGGFFGGLPFRDSGEVTLSSLQHR